MSRKRRSTVVGGVALGAVLALTVSSIGYAEDAPTDPGEVVLQASEALSTEVGLAESQDAAVEGNTVSVDGANEAIDITLPVSPNATDDSSSSGLVSLSDTPSYSIVPLSMEDGSVAIHSVINDASAPTEYSYELDLPDDAVLSVNETTGAVLAVDGEGNLLVGGAAPWTKDANGNDLHTWYTIEGHAIVQHVSFDEATAFPVVADPWLGVDMVSSLYFSWAGSGYKLNINPTPWARGLTGNSLWIPAGEAGWSEVNSKLSTVDRNRLNASAKGQYICHVGFAGFDAQWNLELWKPNKSLAGWVASQCN